MMHFWSKFGKPHFIWFWLIARTNSQAQNGVNLDFQAQFDIEDHCQSPHKTIGILIKVFYISDPNLVILAWTVDELSHGQAHDWRTHRHTHIHTHTHAGNDNTRRPKLASGKNQLQGLDLKIRYQDNSFHQGDIPFSMKQVKPEQFVSWWWLCHSSSTCHNTSFVIHTSNITKKPLCLYFHCYLQV